MHDLDRIQMESFEYEFEGEAQNEAEVFGEAEMEALATELMEVQSEAELEQFLGSLIKKAGSAIGSFVKSPVGQALGGVLKSAVKRGLPTVGSALGGMIGGAQGAKIGGQLGSFASGQINEMEMEMETAKDLVRMAANAVKNAAAAPAGSNPVAVAKAAVAQAIKSLPTAAVRGSAQGRWVRRGNRIVLFGV